MSEIASPNADGGTSTTTDTTTGQATASPTATDPPKLIPVWAQLIVTLLLLVAFFALVWVMLKASKASDEQWQHLVYIFGSCEALAFTAVGWVFGTQVQRSQVASTQATLKQATDDAAASKAETAKQAELATNHKVNLAKLAAAVKIGLTAPQDQAPVAAGRDTDLNDKDVASQADARRAALLKLADDVDPTT